MPEIVLPSYVNNPQTPVQYSQYRNLQRKFPQLLVELFPLIHLSTPQQSTVLNCSLRCAGYDTYSTTTTERFVHIVCTSDLRISPNTSRNTYQPPNVGMINSKHRRDLFKNVLDLLCESRGFGEIVFGVWGRELRTVYASVSRPLTACVPPMGKKKNQIQQ